MRKINLLEVIHPNVGMINNAYEFENRALKQISRGNFEIIEGKVETVIEVNGEKIVIYIDNEIDLCDFRARVECAGNPEPSLIYLKNKLSTVREGSLIEVLIKYKSENLKNGSDLNEEVWFKLYHNEDPNDLYRDHYGAKWIDYEEQLKKGNIIEDSFGINGLWAMPVDVVSKFMTEESFKLFGNHMFRVKTTPNDSYLLDGEEIIGPRYVVLEKFDLTKPDDIRKLIERIDEINEEKQNKRNNIGA